MKKITSLAFALVLLLAPNTFATSETSSFVGENQSLSEGSFGITAVEETSSVAINPTMVASVIVAVVVIVLIVLIINKRKK